jgi:2-amino-4-hydroxy-6-hydroxymethyldihydropteridine diphosphokinase
VLDLDLLLYGAEVIDTPDLTVPHPRLHERAFALAPIVEIDPTVAIPGRGPARDWLARCAEQRVERLPS